MNKLGNYWERAQFFFCALLIMFFSSCDQKEKEKLKIAFMADVHLHDIYGQFQDIDYKGIKNPKDGEYVLIRTMEAQIHSTRVFNENYFAFLAALEDVVRRGIKYVVLPGDFSDDGQYVNIKGIKKILDKYTNEHKLKFIFTTGNHDPVRPFAREAGKKDFLAANGARQAIMSKEGLYVPQKETDLPVIVTKGIKEMGYEEIVTELGDFGFFPKQEYLYWETPFSNYSTKDYTFEKASEAAKTENRNYSIPPFNSKMPDVSYLVEPEEGLWFMAIDANVYIPKEGVDSVPHDPTHYGSASIGYSNVLTHKTHLINWAKKITQKAKELGKTLIVFSHYPMVDFNDDATPHIREMLKEKSMQIHRIPAEEVAELFANAGITLHFGGHMHINDTGVRTTKKGNTIVNVQIPSLAAYIPAYKILTLDTDSLARVETVVIDSVPNFDKLFDLYRTEHDFVTKTEGKEPWDINILSAKSYKEFTQYHLEGLLKNRFLQREWPDSLKRLLLQSSGKDLLTIANLEPSVDLGEALNGEDNFSPEFRKAWKEAENRAQVSIEESGLTFVQFEKWNGFDMIFDLYKLRSADKIAIKDIGKKRIGEYNIIMKTLLKQQPEKTAGANSIRTGLVEFAKIFQMFQNGAPVEVLTLNLKTGKIQNVLNQ